MGGEDWVVMLVTPRLYQQILHDAEDGAAPAILTALAIRTFFTMVDQDRIPERCGACGTPTRLPCEMELLAVGMPRADTVTHKRLRVHTHRPFAIMPLCEGCCEEDHSRLKRRCGSLFDASSTVNAFDGTDDLIGEVAGHA